MIGRVTGFRWSGRTIARRAPRYAATVAAITNPVMSDATSNVGGLLRLGGYAVRRRS
jgi:hypothetical protein